MRKSSSRRHGLSGAGHDARALGGRGVGEPQLEAEL